MTWAKLDDRFHSHPKVRTAWGIDTASVGLHAMALALSANYELDGEVPNWFIEGALPKTRDRQSAIDALITAGLWSVQKDGYVIHDFLDFNPSKQSLQEKREKDAERKRRERDE